MAEDITASIHHLPQPAKRAKTDAERARAYRERKRLTLPAAGKSKIVPADGKNYPAAELLPADGNKLPAVIERDHVTLDVTERITGALNFEGIKYINGLAGDSTERVTQTLTAPSPFPNQNNLGAGSTVPFGTVRKLPNFSSFTLTASAIALAGTGITVNAWYARSLGATDVAGWLFLAIGVGADCAALALPSVAARLWDARQRAKAMAGWLVWFMTFVFAVTAGIGFASVNIADVTSSRASRVTPAVTQAKTALDDAMAARDRECKGGVGKWCREREAAVAAARDQVTHEMASVEAISDPQADAAIGLAAWLSGGILKPTEHDFAMLRLILLALLPQIGGVLLMLGRSPNQLTANSR